MAPMSDCWTVGGGGAGMAEDGTAAGVVGVGVGGEVDDDGGALERTVSKSCGSLAVTRKEYSTAWDASLDSECGCKLNIRTRNDCTGRGPPGTTHTALYHFLGVEASSSSLSR